MPIWCILNLSLQKIHANGFFVVFCIYPLTIPLYHRTFANASIAYNDNLFIKNNNKEKYKTHHVCE